jgi:predicted transcriptional regulator
MAKPGNLTIVISARIGAGEPHDIGEIELPVVTENTHTAGHVTITARVRVDEDELKRRLDEFAAAVSDEMAVAAPKKRHAWVQEALAFAEAGRRVAIIETKAQEAHAWFNEFVEVLDKNQVAKISRTSGRQGIDFRSGGVLRFTSVRSQGSRGASFDRLYVSAAVSEEEKVQLPPLVDTSEEPAIISFP